MMHSIEDIRAGQPKFDLPLKKVTDPIDYTLYTSMLVKIIRSQGIKVITGQKVDIEAECKLFIDMVFNVGYSSGLRHMDQMHRLTDRIE